MSRRTQFSIGEYYHIYSRGNDKRDIFLDVNDKMRFMKLLYLCNNKNIIIYKTIPSQDVYAFKRGARLVNVGAYCLMPNHFHLLVRERIRNGISMFTQKFLTAYSMYFNLKNDRTGKLFEGPFKAQHVDDDIYLRYLFAYIHLNPAKLVNTLRKEKTITLKKHTEHFLESYPYSSYPDYIGLKRAEHSILNTQHFPRYFSSSASFKIFIDEVLKIQGEALDFSASDFMRRREI